MLIPRTSAPPVAMAASTVWAKDAQSVELPSTAQKFGEHRLAVDDLVADRVLHPGVGG